MTSYTSNKFCFRHEIFLLGTRRFIQVNIDKEGFVIVCTGLIFYPHQNNMHIIAMREFTTKENMCYMRFKMHTQALNINDK